VTAVFSYNKESLKNLENQTPITFALWLSAAFLDGTFANEFHPTIP
jgi:hypothetical protein